MRSRMLSVALFALLGWAPAKASTPLVTEAWQVDAWSIEEGLPASTVTAIAPTADGRLWLGTFAGLSRFDGQRIDPVGEPSDDRPVRITALAPDGEAVWIGTESEGLWRLEEGAYTRVETPSAVVDTVIGRVVPAPDGALWLSTSLGAWRRDSAGEWDRIHDAMLFDLDIAEDGTAWLCGASVWTWRPGEQVETRGTVAESDDCFGGVIAPDGSYLTLKGDRIEIHDQEGIRAFRVEGLDADHDGEPFICPSNRLWVGSRESLLDVGDWEQLNEGVDGDVVAARKRHDLKGTVRDVHSDEPGSVWVGTTGGGLHRVSPMGFTRITRTDMRGGGSGAGPAVAAGGSVYFTLDCGNLLRSADEGAPEPAPLPPDTDCISALGAEPDGSVLVARGGDLLRLGPDGSVQGLLDGPSATIKLVSSDERGGIWLGAEDGHLGWLAPDGELRDVDVPAAVAGRKLLSLLHEGDDLVLGFDGGVALRERGSWRAS